jgi:hypothetical protein
VRGKRGSEKRESGDPRGMPDIQRRVFVDPMIGSKGNDRLRREDASPNP